ncbi:T9SS type A sorting domain-containing protein [Flavobacterium sp. TP390]|uniref:T9SS type A sorting domain-containing protein n=1 Tax=Flavobacterium profundi TaxID=1774945 RepID=A0A6I4IFT8_9FLAO|nr:T9SS type A sorting domain-containing protein [Flavobacterium profundi]MVO08478.1 T9SS type A sorting domain-containing protein [Flavobacterium profundi]
MKQSYLFLILAFFLNCISLHAQNHVPFSTRLPQGNIEVKGDLVLIGNNILNRQSGVNSANVPYMGTGSNNGFNMQYIDIDNDAATFSSSSADLDIPSDCKRIVYAGLYWGAKYRSETDNQNNEEIYTDWNTVKFKIPNGEYIDIIADEDADPIGEEDDIIIGATELPITSVPYVCYKNVTSLLQGLSDANGTYTIANQRASRGAGFSGGWNLIIIYESPFATSKNITIFDGLSEIVASSPPLDIVINGFTTIPVGSVKVKLGIASLEGDRSFTDDRFRINGTSMSTPNRIANNFFNSTISNNGMPVNRVPNSSNTLGLDLDIFNVPNPSNSVIANNATSATFTLETDGDTYDPYLFALVVDIVEPKIVITQSIENTIGNDITNQPLRICQEVVYGIQFQNTGTDDAVNTTIKKVLPLNITFNPNTDLVLPTGVALTSYDAGTRTLVFTIDDNLVTQNSSVQEIRIHAKVVCSCLDLDTSCTNVFSSESYATYRGIVNTAVFSDEMNITNFGCTTTSYTIENDLLASSCDTNQVVYICNPNTVLSGTNGYTSYNWNSPTNSNFSVVSGTNNQSIEVQQAGIYEVLNEYSGVSCRSMTESFSVRTCFPSNQVTQNGYLLSAVENDETYQWIDCDTNLPIVGANTQDFVVTNTGNYAVIITNGIGNSVTSDCIPITVLNNESFQKSDFLIYPNPTLDSFKVESSFTIQKITISNLLGQEIKTFLANENSFSISELNSGTYLIKIFTEKGTYTSKINKK